MLPDPLPPRLPDGWRFQTGEGEPLSAARLRRAWQRPPFALHVRLVDTAPARPAILAQARLGTRDGLDVFLARAARLTALLLRMAQAGTGPRLDPADDAAVVHEAGEPSRWWHGRVRQQRARWRSRLLAEHWSVGIAACSLQDLAAGGELGTVRWIGPPHAPSLADPFEWPGTGRILCEEMPAGPGRIVCLEPDGDGGFRQGRVILSAATHLSYPSTFHDGEATYLLPESGRSGTTTLWRLERDGSLSFVAEPAPGKVLADPTLFRQGDIYWMAATDEAIGLHDNLCLFHAEAPQGPWHAHTGNPVKIDIAGARPAGTPFRSGGRLIRPAQDCAAAYGAAVVLQEVVELTASRFAERTLRRIAPHRTGPGRDGLHTISGFGGQVLVDGRRLVFSPRALGAKLSNRLGGMRRRNLP